MKTGKIYGEFPLNKTYNPNNLTLSKHLDISIMKWLNENRELLFFFSECSTQWQMAGATHHMNVAENEKWIDASDCYSWATHMPRFVRTFIYMSLLRAQYTSDDINETRSFRSFFNLITPIPSHLLINRFETTYATHFIP